MPTGEIIKWFDNRGFGFLSNEDRLGDMRGVFLHVSAVKQAPEIGDRFTYDIIAGLDGRPVAGNVEPLTAEIEEARRVFGE